jgi:hypothetical protein
VELSSGGMFDPHFGLSAHGVTNANSGVRKRFMTPSGKRILEIV